MEFFLFGIILFFFGGILIILYLREIFKDNKKIVSLKIKMERLKICDGCEHVRLQNTIYKRCVECGCFLHPKANLKNQKCPIGKWLD